LPNRSLWPNLEQLDHLLIDADDIGILTDADGTLSEIRDQPHQASVPEAVSVALGRLNKLYGLVAVVSGRRAQDVQALVGQEDLLYLGNHGLERRRGKTTHMILEAIESRAAIEAVRVELEKRLPAADGLYVENKETVLALHYRQCRDGAAIEAAIDLASSLAAKYRLRVQHGRQITEVRPRGADKGDAVKKLVSGRRLKQIIYLGDDSTDIDAIDALKKASRDNVIDTSIAIAVVGTESPVELREKADYWVSSVDEVARFLDWLVKRAERRSAAQ